MTPEEIFSRDVDSLRFLGFLNTPPLWNSTRYFPFPQFSIKKPGTKKFSDLPSPPNMVLGKRIELFFHYFIEHFSEEEVIAANTQIISEKVTLGELDFLLQNKQTQTTTHLEVVYKFYLYEPNFSEEIKRWIGPNRKDSLARKLSRLRDHQFPLLYKKETRDFLREYHLSPEVIEQKVLFKALLFVPAGSKNTSYPLINKECISGNWIKFSEFTEADYGQGQFFSPKKPDWPVSPENCLKWYSYAEIKNQITMMVNKKRSPLIWMKTNEQEFVRFFIVWW